MQVKLVVIAGASKTGEITVNPPMTFGRSRDADLTLRHALISRKHCEIAESNGQIVVRDLGSLNGTFIGGQRINEAPLKDGDELMVGSVTFRVTLSGAADAAGATQGSIPQGVDPETGLQFLEPVDAVETVPAEQIQPTVQPAAVAESTSAESSSESSPSVVGVLQGTEEATIQPAVAEPASAAGADETPIFGPDDAQAASQSPAASQSNVAFDLNEDTPSVPDSDDSALGSFLKKL